MVWQMGYSEPPKQGMQRQIVPSSYQQASVGSSHAPAAGSGVAGHAAGSGTVSAQSAGGCMTDQDPSVQSAVVRHLGRRSSPQLHWAEAKPNAEPEREHLLPVEGTSRGHTEAAAPPDPPDAPDPPPLPPFVVPPPQARASAKGNEIVIPTRMIYWGFLPFKTQPLKVPRLTNMPQLHLPSATSCRVFQWRAGTIEPQVASACTVQAITVNASF